MSTRHVVSRIERVSKGDRLLRASRLSLIGVPVALVVLVVWENVVSTSAMLDDGERVRGWESVLRELPASLLLVAPTVVGLVLAVRAARYGVVGGAMRAIVWHGLALAVVLVILGSGAAEDVMRTRPSTVKWLLVPVELAIAAGAAYAARRAARSSSSGQGFPSNA